MKLPVMMRCQWADGSFDDEPAFGIVSGDTSMVSITANANGDSMATITPADSQSHLVAITGPPTLVTDCPACSADTVLPTGLVGVPPQTPSQHTYPNPPLNACRVSVPFDGVINHNTGKKHQAQDTVGSNIQVGTPVFAPESGRITQFVQGKPHDPRPAPQCAGQNSPADFIEITGADGGITRLYHVSILSSLAQMPLPIAVTGGQQIGTIDISGCTSAPHTHIQRKVNGVLVNFTMPCDNSHFDDPGSYYDDSDGTF